MTTYAQGGTSPAASLWPFYQRKEVVKTFIMVTDEEENGNSNGFRWMHLSFGFIESGTNLDMKISIKKMGGGGGGKQQIK